MPFQIRPAGDSALVVEFEWRVDPAINARVIALADAVRAEAHAGVRDVVSTYCSVSVYFDPLRTNLDALMAALARQAATAVGLANAHPTPTVVPVCYGGEHGPDLEEVARFASCSPEEVVRLHTAVVYRVYMLGFVSGFAYLGRVDARIAMPRRQSPRLRVPTGSVGIAGVQTGVYPTETPGGWRLIGRTPLRPFSADREPPFLFKPGDAVTFQPIDPSSYAAAAECTPRSSASS